MGFRDLGEHYLRGLSRPERLYQVTAAGLAADFPPLHTESKPDRPSIAVLAYETLGDTGRSSFADELVEDLITALSRCRDLFVIARNSTFAYKGTHVDVGAVAAKLGVRYVLEGSVQWFGDQARVTAQLIDGTISDGYVLVVVLCTSLRPWSENQLTGQLTIGIRLMRGSR